MSNSFNTKSPGEAHQNQGDLAPGPEKRAQAATRKEGRICRGGQFGEVHADKHRGTAGLPLTSTAQHLL